MIRTEISVQPVKRRTIAGVCAAAALIAACGALIGCADSPFAEREGDLGRFAPMDRLRKVDGLEIERLRAEAGGKDAAAQSAMPTLPDEVTAQAAADALKAMKDRVKARQEIELSLPDARAHALRNNLDLRVRVMDPAIARQELDAERAKFDAVFTPGASLSSVDNPSPPGAAGTRDNRFRTAKIGSGVSIPLRTGGRATVDFTHTITDSNSLLDTDGVVHSPALTFSIAQPLLRGAGREANVASITIAGYQVQATEARTKLAVIAQLANAERAYWLVAAARRELEVRQQQYELAAELLARAERRLKAGDAKQVDVVRAQSGVASRLEAVISAETNVLIAQRDLKRLVNMPDAPIGDRAMVKPTTEAALTELDLDSRATELVTLARAQRMELLESELQLLADALNIDVAKNATLPGLDLSASHTFAGGNRSVGQGFGDLLTGRFTGTTVGVQGEVPLTNDAAEANYRRAVLTRVQRIATRQARVQTIEQEVLDAADRVRSAWQRIMAARQSSLLAGRTLQAEQRLFDQGLRTATDVLDASAALADAQSSENRAIVDYQIALVDLATATGTTLGSAGVRWEEAGGAGGDR